MGARGGKRIGAGAKPKAIAKLRAEFALEVLENSNAFERWNQLATSADDRIAMDALKYLSDRAFGKAKQLMDLNVEGKLEIGRVVVNL